MKRWKRLFNFWREPQNTPPAIRKLAPGVVRLQLPSGDFRTGFFANFTAKNGKKTLLVTTHSANGIGLCPREGCHLTLRKGFWRGESHSDETIFAKPIAVNPLLDTVLLEVYRTPNGELYTPDHALSLSEPKRGELTPGMDIYCLGHPNGSVQKSSKSFFLGSNGDNTFNISKYFFPGEKGSAVFTAAGQLVGVLTKGHSVENDNSPPDTPPKNTVYSLTESTYVSSSALLKLFEESQADPEKVREAVGSIPQPVRQTTPYGALELHPSGQNAQEFFINLASDLTSELSKVSGTESPVSILHLVRGHSSPLHQNRISGKMPWCPLSDMTKENPDLWKKWWEVIKAGISGIPEYKVFSHITLRWILHPLVNDWVPQDQVTGYLTWAQEKVLSKKYMNSDLHIAHLLMVEPQAQRVFGKTLEELLEPLKSDDTWKDMHSLTPLLELTYTGLELSQKGLWKSPMDFESWAENILSKLDSSNYFTLGELFVKDELWYLLELIKSQKK